MTDTYVLLDSKRTVPQNLQHQIIRSYAIEANLNIIFYGAEFMALEDLHFQLLSYARKSEYSSFLLYSIYQLYNPISGFDLTILKTILKEKKTLHFAAQALSITSLSELQAKYSELLVAHTMLFNRNTLTELKVMINSHRDLNSI